MTDLIIVVSPAFGHRSKRKHGQFEVRLKNCDEIICKATRQPLLDAARILLWRGFHPSTVIFKVRSNAPTTVSMRATVGVAALYDVLGEKLVRRKPDAGPMSGAERENPLSAELGTPCRTKAALRASYSRSTKAANTPSPAPSPTTTGK